MPPKASFPPPVLTLVETGWWNDVVMTVVRVRRMKAVIIAVRTHRLKAARWRARISRWFLLLYLSALGI